MSRDNGCIVAYLSGPYLARAELIMEGGLPIKACPGTPPEDLDRMILAFQHAIEGLMQIRSPA